MTIDSKFLISVPPGFFPLPIAAAWAGVSCRTVQRWLASGLPYHQAGPGTKILIKPSDVERFLTRHQATKSAGAAVQ